MQKLKRWYARNFRIISIQEAQKLGLTHEETLHGNEANRFKCRSLWVDENDKFYRVDKLI